MIFAAFFLIISIAPVYAQRGGHGGGSHASSGGSHGGFSSGHSGGFPSHSGFSGGYGGSHVGVGSGWVNGSRGVRIRTYGYGYRRGYPYWGYGYPWGYYVGIDPYWWWDTYPSESDSDQRAEASAMNEQNLEEQQALRDQDQDLYARNSGPRQSATTASQEDNSPATVLVYRDQHQREVQNYAIVDEMLWIFTPQRIEKVPLAILDVPATIKANEDRGVDFRLPESRAGQ